MNKFAYGIILTTILFAQSVFADAMMITTNVDNVTGFVIKAELQNTGSTQVLIPTRSCSVVNVPIYGKTGGAQTGEVLGGAIIGGILGNQVGGGKGKDAATILGAILGADYANKKGGQQTIVGYKQVEQCEIINKVTWQENPPKCRVTVKVPAMNNSLHTFILNKCPTLNDTFTITAKYSLRYNR